MTKTGLSAQSQVCAIPPTGTLFRVSSLFVSGGNARCSPQTLAQGRTQNQPVLGTDQVIVLLRITARAKDPSKRMDITEQKLFPSRMTKNNSQSAL